MIIKGKTLRIPIYNIKTRVFIATSIKEIYEAKGWEGGDDFDAGVFYDDESVSMDLVLPPDCPPDIVVHEVIHMVTTLCKFVEMRIDPENDESIAYLAQYIFKEVWEFINA